MKLINSCSICGAHPFDGYAVYRDKGSLWHNGKGRGGIGPLFCALCAPAKIKEKILANWRIDPETRALASAQPLKIAAE